ncbi:uncharacterized protein [Antedon mediterranea]|uniref:uncharacterized protein n=1 Tax=Antedon mediterranea TaxID=105859 RepID=UPI003AF99891
MTKRASDVIPFFTKKRNSYLFHGSKMYRYFVCLFLIASNLPPSGSVDGLSFSYEEASGTGYHNTYNFYYGGSGKPTIDGNSGFALSFSQQDALRTWQSLFDNMSGTFRRDSIESSTSPIQFNLKQQCEMLTLFRGFFTGARYADASVCTSILGSSGDSARVGVSSTTTSGFNGLDDEPTGCSALSDICQTVTNVATPSIGFTIDGNVPVVIPQLAELGYNQEFLEHDCVSSDCTWPPFAFNDLRCTCCQTTRGENALVVGLGPSIVVAKVAVTKGNCVAKLQPVI